jgi:hypothetical protein
MILTNGMTQLEFLSAINGAANFDIIPNPCSSDFLKSSLNTHFNLIETEVNRSGLSGVDFEITGNLLNSRLTSNFELTTDIKTVGISKQFTSITAGISESNNNDYLLIDADTYTEKIDLSIKKLNLIALGEGASILYTEAVSTIEKHSTLTLLTDSTFKRIIFKKQNNNAVNSKKEIVYISGCVPTFTDSQIASDQTNNALDILLVENGAIVTMLNGSIDCNGVIASGVDALISVKDTSIFNFSGTKLKAQVIAEDDSIVDINVDHLWSPGNGNRSLKAIDYATVSCTINTQHHGYYQATNIEFDPWIQKMELVWLLNGATFNCYGKLNGQINVAGTNNHVLIKNITADSGHCRIVGAGPEGGSPNTNVITIDNSTLYLDISDDILGLHSIEDPLGCEWHIINGSVIEFSGYSGESITWGQTISIHGAGAKLYIKDSPIIDNCNDKNGYAMTIAMNGLLDMENVEITNKNWDGLDPHSCIALYKTGTRNTIQCKLKNVTFNNATLSNPIGIRLYDGAVIDENDYICIDGIINNTGLPISSDMTKYNILLSHCPF